jgi:hypothetical protein
VWNFKLVDFVYPYLDGSFTSHYFSYIDFFLNLGVKGFPKEIKYFLKTHKVGLIYPLEDIIVATQKPNIINKNNNGLHKDGGVALSYNDNGLSDIYSLNGVVMPKEYVITPAEKLDVKIILTEKNAEIRRELIRKIGIGRFLEVSNSKVLDEKGNYELLSIELSGEVKDAKYLKMINPSIGCFHVEPVSPECLTVEESINWRAFGETKKSWNPWVLT